MLGQDTILLNTGSFSPRISVQVLLESLKVIQEGTKEVSILSKPKHLGSNSAFKSRFETAYTASLGNTREKVLLI